MLISGYLQTLTHLNYQIDYIGLTALLCNAHFSELIPIITENARKVCEYVQTYRLGVQDTLFQDVLFYINEKLGNTELCRDQIADQFGISVYALSRLFRDNMDIGFKEYLISKRIERAAFLLKTTNLSVIRISEETGFSSSNYFSRLFHQATGISPGQYRTKA